MSGSDSMLRCNPDNFGYILRLLSPWEKLAELMFRIGAGLGVRQATPAGSSSCLLGTSSVTEGVKSRLFELTLSRLDKVGVFMKGFVIALKLKKNVSVIKEAVLIIYER